MKARSRVLEVPTLRPPSPLDPNRLERVHAPYVPLVASSHCPSLGACLCSLVPRPP